MKLRRKLRRLVRKPFKGSSAYELQLGGIVFQIPFGTCRHLPCYQSRITGRCKVLHVWFDPYWKTF